MTILRRGDPCVRYRPVLADWAEHRTEGPATASALDHLDRCRRCELEITELTQTIIAVRRLAARASAIAPPTDGWRDLRVRLVANERPPRSAGRWAVTGSMLGPAVLAILFMQIAGAPIAPIADAVVDEGIRGSTSTVLTRPIYDTGLGRLTEGIVLVLSGRTQPTDGRAVRLSISPSSTDRRDVPAPARRVSSRSELTPARTGARS